MSTAIEQLRLAAVPLPLIGDGVEHWLEPRVAAMLRKAGFKTSADLTLRVARRCRWWADIGGLGVTGARRIEAFFAAHPDLTVLSAMFRGLIEQRYVLANPFAGIKVRGARQATLHTTRAFSDGE